jgi:hypothetical protein
VGTRAALRPGIVIKEDLIAVIVEKTRGNARKIAATLHAAKTFAQNSGLQELSVSNYLGTFHTGEPQNRKR